MKYCTRCCYPHNTRPAMSFDEQGLCSGCRTAEKRNNEPVDWSEKQKKLSQILEVYKQKAKDNGSPYDCIIPISGGKDSHYQAHLIINVYKLKPLFVAYNHAYNTKVGIRNLTNMVEKFGCDLVRYTTNPKTAKKISRYMLKKVGDVTWHYHAGIMTFPIQTALHYKIPLMIWGEHGESYLYGMHNLDDDVEFTKKHRQEHLMRGFEPEDILDDPDNTEITKADLAPFFYPKDEELENIGLRGIYISNFYPWDEFDHTQKMIEQYQFETFQNRQMSFNLYQKVEDFFQDTHNYLKYLKFGYGRVTDQVSIEIRNQTMTKDEGIKLIEKYEHNVRPTNLDVFLKFTDISEKQFLGYIEHLRDSAIWEKKSDGSFELLDWVGNHKNDDGVDNVKLPLKKKWFSLKSSRYTHPRDYAHPENDDDLVYL